MTPEQKAAYISAQCVCAYSEIAAMEAANKERESKGFSLAYGEEAFLEVQNKYCLGANDVLGFFR
jgi:hypothetical protein